MLKKDLRDMDVSKEELNSAGSVLKRHLRKIDEAKQSLTDLQKPLRSKLSILKDLQGAAAFAERRTHTFGKPHWTEIFL